MNRKEFDFLQTAAPAAMAAMRATGVPASVTLAQCILESGWMEHMPKGSNNPFGIKALHRDQPDTYVEAATAEWVNGKLEPERQAFQKFASLAEAFTEHANLLAHAPRYQPAMALKRWAQAFCVRVEECGYSTNRPGLAKGPKFYADQLIELIEEFDLTQYDPAPAA